MNRPSEIQLGMFGREDERLGHPLWVEKWSNRKAFWIGVHAGQGLSAPAIERALGEQDTANVIAHMMNVWGFRLDGEKHTHGIVRVPVAAVHRTDIAREATARETDLPDLCRQILAGVAAGDLYKAVLDL